MNMSFTAFTNSRRRIWGCSELEARSSKNVFP